ncbi:glycoside hydrolase family 26 protein [Arthrobacter sp. NPDC056691]|uniref:glycoside hydrolase family 26 protein n=1 Tax=Arthrobacter sp. NPDC056691 TaxID=3345913 RepID=UPI00366EB1C1
MNFSWGRTTIAVAAGLVLAGCSPAPETQKAPSPTVAACEVTSGAKLAPASGILSGVNLDWEHETLQQYAGGLGRRPAVVVSFTQFPFTAADEANLEAAYGQVRGDGGILLLTLEPRKGLAAVTQAATDKLAGTLDRFNKAGVPVIVRFAHEMNGSWYEWGQQPAEYKAAFRRVAGSIHRLAPGSATMWAPNYGGGYPFTGGAHQAVAGTAAYTALDTDKNGEVTGADDPYAPYYPGDDAVDWVGMSLYHWGNTYPWGANVVPEPGKFLQQLTGTYNGAGGNDLAVPDFYGEYGKRRGKPVAIPETAALSVPSRGGAKELAIKQAWWRQLFDARIPKDYPQLKMINWFEWNKNEVEVKAVVDWRSAGTPAIAKAYTADLPDWFQFAQEPKECTPAQ